MRGVAALALAGAFAAAPTAAADRAGALVAAWRGWVEATGIERSAVAVSEGPRIAAEAAVGQPAGLPRPVASLSKAITAACVLALVEAGRLALDDRLADLLAGRPDLLPPGAEAGALTVAALLTHSGGLAPDATQYDIFGRWLAGGPAAAEAIVARALARPLRRAVHAYNNENYAVLGAVIGEITGRPAPEHCIAAVLAPLGITSAAIAPELSGGADFGGYVITAADFARFAATLAPRPDWPRTPLGEGLEYGPGVILRPVAAGADLWHFGSLCVLRGVQAGAFFLRHARGWTVAATYDACLEEAAARALFVALLRAAGGAGG